MRCETTQRRTLRPAPPKQIATPVSVGCAILGVSPAARYYPSERRGFTSLSEPVTPRAYP